MKKTFDEVFIDNTKLGTKVPTSEYGDAGKYIIVDQGQSQIAGYTDEEQGVFKDVPAIIFGDHTRVIKYVDRPFFLGADGTKILKSKLKDTNYKYLFYALKNVRILNTGYNRHFKWLKMVSINYPSLLIQSNIAVVLDKLAYIIECKQRELELYDELVKARFVEMFGDIKNEEKYSGILLGNICKTISGGTPSTKVTEYYTGDIPWISTVSLGPNHIDGKLAKGYITSLAIKNSATKLIPAGNILFGTRVGVGKSSINDVEMCTNQDIVAIVDVDECKYNKLFIKCVLDSYQAYFDSIKKGATILGVTSDDLKDCLIPNVPINIQNEFVVFVEQVDKSKLLNTSIIYTLFVGMAYTLLSTLSLLFSPSGTKALMRQFVADAPKAHESLSIEARRVPVQGTTIPLISVLITIFRLGTVVCNADIFAGV